MTSPQDPLSSVGMHSSSLIIQLRVRVSLPTPHWLSQSENSVHSDNTAAAEMNDKILFFYKIAHIAGSGTFAFRFETPNPHFTFPPGLNIKCSKLFKIRTHSYIYHHLLKIMASWLSTWGKKNMSGFGLTTSIR